MTTYSGAVIVVGSITYHQGEISAQNSPNMKREYHKNADIILFMIWLLIMCMFQP